jgi:predicted Rossmann fold flavoprotein
MVTDLVIVGGGAAGLACAVTGAREGLKVVLLEKTDRCGRKLALTGGKKGNFTHAESPREMAARFDCEPRQILPLLRRFPYQRIVEYFAGLGIRARTDEDGCVWPVGTDAAGIRDALEREATRLGCEIRKQSRVVELAPSWCVRLSDGTEISARNLCLATGGASYPSTGSTGDGLSLAGKLGLRVVPWFPALASLATRDDLSRLAGISQPRVRMELQVAGQAARTAVGHFIFAHGYVSGSSVLNLCGYAARALASGKQVVLQVDWVPDLNPTQLTGELEAGRREHPRQQLSTFLCRYVARRLADVILQKAGVAVGRVLADLTRDERQRVIAGLKETRFEIAGTEPIERATTTGGGVALDEVDLNTMQVRRFPGLYCAGEVLDVWAETGGYSLHFAWAAGIAAAEAAVI